PGNHADRARERPEGRNGSTRERRGRRAGGRSNHPRQFCPQRARSRTTGHRRLSVHVPALRTAVAPQRCGLQICSEHRASQPVSRRRSIKNLQTLVRRFNASATPRISLRSQRAAGLTYRQQESEEKKKEEKEEKGVR